MSRRWMWVVAFASGALCAACGEASAPHPRAANATDDEVVITERAQRDAAVGRRVTIIGIQTRTKLPTVCGVDVDGAYELSDREVTVSGVLERHVVTEVDPMTANRGPGTFYAVVDPSTKQLAKTSPH